MEIAISAAKGHLSALIKAAREGKQVLLTRHGRPVAEIRAIAPAMTAGERIKQMTQISHKAAAMAQDDVPATRAADFLYDDTGMPA
ncbi:type II toxin-antitoxin system Phd/YefM family antitoxin [Thalassospira sp.]|uniref:type II toxin-antitoxin system Phd/YefM family antitoxin n=1 Tax=Thalassospira sp. TaxID=1912094 RepID=UPI0027375322|nr:type II toxin-antitoxin system prevent-host-death family antitoxin [Thalassospira sp.]MDP2698745.1 type II toxin-antitoxin system prevent-host-death family antitoxin [Thalassospira sp.]